MVSNEQTNSFCDATCDFEKLKPFSLRDLSGNGLAVCVEDGFVLANTSLPSLHTLKFASNRVRVIPLRAFHNFPALEYLDLSDNPIASIQEGAFEPLHLKQLFVYLNDFFLFLSWVTLFITKRLRAYLN